MTDHNIVNEDYEFFKAAAIGGTQIVKTFEEARNRAKNSTSPMIIKFASLSLGREDSQALIELSSELRESGILVTFDEADFLETKLERSERIAATLKNGIRRN